MSAVITFSYFATMMAGCSILAFSPVELCILSSSEELGKGLPNVWLCQGCALDRN